MSAKDALDKFYRRQSATAERQSRPRRRNGRPEWNLTAKPCMAWFKANGWAMSIVEAKAVFSHEAGRYIAGQAVAGFADAVGCAPDGTAAFIEFKAPNRRSTLKPHQYEFLKERLMKTAFAVCVDSVACLEQAWHTFIERRRIEPMLARNYLLKHLPQLPGGNDSFEELFEEAK